MFGNWTLSQAQDARTRKGNTRGWTTAVLWVAMRQNAQRNAANKNNAVKGCLAERDCRNKKRIVEGGKTPEEREKECVKCDV